MANTNSTIINPWQSHTYNENDRLSPTWARTASRLILLGLHEHTELQHSQQVRITTVKSQCYYQHPPHHWQTCYPGHLSACLFFHMISQRNNARITKLHTKMIHKESWTSIHLGVKRSKVEVVHSFFAGRGPAYSGPSTETFVSVQCTSPGRRGELVGVCSECARCVRWRKEQ